MANADGPESGVLLGPARAPEIHLMSWNIRRRIPSVLARSADRWQHRASRVSALLSAERPTVLCAQEVLPEQMSALHEGLGCSYREIGHGRARDGGGEACPILYDADRLDLEKWRQSALSDTPHVPGSMSWGNMFPRILVRAVFRDRATSRCFQVINTHLDLISARSRSRSAVEIGERLNDSAVPAVVAGDFNAGPRSSTARYLVAAGLTDSWTGARQRRTREWGTYGGYRLPRRHGPRIDRILTTPCVTVTAVAINPTRHEGGWPSDHLPVQAVVQIDGARQAGLPPTAPGGAELT